MNKTAAAATSEIIELGARVVSTGKDSNGAAQCLCGAVLFFRREDERSQVARLVDRGGSHKDHALVSHMFPPSSTLAAGIRLRCTWANRDGALAHCHGDQKTIVL